MKREVVACVFRSPDGENILTNNVCELRKLLSDLNYGCFVICRDSIPKAKETFKNNAEIMEALEKLETRRTLFYVDEEGNFLQEESFLLGIMYMVSEELNG